MRNFGETYGGYLPLWNVIFDSAGNLYSTTTYGGGAGGVVFELTQ